MRTKRGVVATVVLTLGLAGCGGSPTSNTGGGEEGAANQPANAGDALEKVYQELEGLEGEARTKKLVELAEEEDSTPTWYTSMNLEDSAPLVEAFDEKYGIEPELYRASSSDVLARLLQESKAGYAGADLVGANGPEMQLLDDEKLLLPLDVPMREDIFEGARYDNWLGNYLNVPVAAWNTKAISESEAPKTWEEVLTDPPGDLAMELGDWDWFATLVEYYFMEEEGMSEDEAVELFRQAARQSTVVDGHTTMAELMVAGEFDITASAYQHRILQLEDEGAPVSWDAPAPVEPIVIRPNGLGIYRDTDAPATTLLFIEFSLTEGQEIIADINRTPANTEYGGVPAKYETLTTDLDELNEERGKWEKLYDEVVHLSGEDVVEGD